MTQEEKWEEEFQEWWMEEHPLYRLITPDVWREKECLLSRKSWLESRRRRKET